MAGTPAAGAGGPSAQAPEGIAQSLQDVLAELKRQTQTRFGELAEPERNEASDAKTDPSAPAEISPTDLAHAAACYAHPMLTALVGVRTWPWAEERFALADPRTNYVRAAALLLAAVDELDRQARDEAANPGAKLERLLASMKS